MAELRNTTVNKELSDGTLFEPVVPLRWPENREGWTVEQLDWADPSNQQRARGLNPTGGWRWHGGVALEGRSVAGCLEVLDLLRGTQWWPALAGAVLFLETSEDQPPPEHVTYLLRSLALTGELEALAGIVFGRPGGADLPVQDHRQYDDAILRVVRDEQGLHDLPVVTNVDVGYTDPIWTVPQGTTVRIDPTGRAVPSPRPRSSDRTPRPLPAPAVPHESTLQPAGPALRSAA